MFIVKSINASIPFLLAGLMHLRFNDCVLKILCPLFILLCTLQDSALSQGQRRETLVPSPDQTVNLLMFAIENYPICEEIGFSKQQINELYLDLNRAGRVLNRKTSAESEKQATRVSISLKINQVLLPHQLKRMSQLDQQSKAVRNLPTLNLLSGRTPRDLELSTRDQAQLRKIGKTFDVQLSRLLEQHRKAKTDLMLDRDQKIKALLKGPAKQKLDRRFGKPFWFFLDVYIDQQLNRWPDEKETDPQVERLR